MEVVFIKDVFNQARAGEVRRVATATPVTT